MSKGLECATVDPYCFLGIDLLSLVLPEGTVLDGEFVVSWANEIVK